MVIVEVTVQVVVGVLVVVVVAVVVVVVVDLNLGNRLQAYRPNMTVDQLCAKPNGVDVDQENGANAWVAFGGSTATPLRAQALLGGL